MTVEDQTSDSYLLCPESGILMLHPLRRKSVIKKAPSKPQDEPTKEATVWPSVTIVNDKTKTPEKYDDNTTNQVKPTPGVGKQRMNPVTASAATFGACNNPIHAHPLQLSAQDDLTYKCDECSFSAIWAGEFFNHKAQVHGLQVPGDSSDPLLYFLAEQNEEYRTNLIETMLKVQSLTDHVQTLTNQLAQFVGTWAPANCTKCNYTAANSDLLSSHMTTKHRPRAEPSNCTKCDYTAANSDLLSNHMKTKHRHRAEPLNESPDMIPAPQEQQEVLASSLPSAQPPTYAEQVRGGPTTAQTFNCAECRYKCSNQDKLSRHANMKHNRVYLGPQRTLLVGDSRVKSLDPRVIEKALGDGLLYVPGSLKIPLQPQGQSRGHPGRAYCSSRDWPYSKFPAASLEDRVPELLAVRNYTNLVVQAPCSDITNILKVQDRSSHRGLACQSALNTLAVVEQALRVNPSLQQAMILEHLPRADSDYLNALSQHSSAVLREAVAASKLNDKIVVAPSSPLECTNEQKMIDMFGARDSPRSDGIHLLGDHGKRLYTDFVLGSLKSANRAWTTIRSRSRRIPQMEQVSQATGPSRATNNRYGPLLN